MASSFERILRNNKALLLSMDQGLEYGPKIFDMHSINPDHAFNIALEGDYTGIIVNPGIAEKYFKKEYQDVPIVLKLNGRSQLNTVNPVARQFCTVDRAIKLGASAVGYTIYDGAPAEDRMFAEFGQIVEQAHDYGIPVIAWMYPRGKHVSDQDSDVMAYSARIGLELGADFIKLKYNNDPGGFSWAVKSAGKSKVLVADPKFKSNQEILEHTHEVMKNGASGIAFGKTIWQHPRPFSLTRALHAMVFRGKKPEDALKYFE